MLLRYVLLSISEVELSGDGDQDDMSVLRLSTEA